jgi:hypothetical protein
MGLPVPIDPAKNNFTKLIEQGQASVTRASGVHADFSNDAVKLIVWQYYV